MKTTMPTWPQTLLIMAFGMTSIVCGYFLSHMRESWGSSAWALLAIFVLSGMGFLATVLVFYLRPQYGGRAFPFLLLFLCGHVVVVAILWRMGVLG